MADNITDDDLKEVQLTEKQDIQKKTADVIYGWPLKKKIWNKGCEGRTIHLLALLESMKLASLMKIWTELTAIEELH